MPAISNTSPLLNLSIIDHLFLLPQQFRQVYIPTAVLTELKVDEPRPGSVYLQDAIKEGWLVLYPVNNTPDYLPRFLLIIYYERYTSGLDSGLTCDDYDGLGLYLHLHP